MAPKTTSPVDGLVLSFTNITYLEMAVIKEALNSQVSKQVDKWMSDREKQE